MHLTASHQRERWIESEFSYHWESVSGPIKYEVKVANRPADRVVGYQINLDRNGERQRLGLLDVHRHEELKELGILHPECFNRQALVCWMSSSTDSMLPTSRGYPRMQRIRGGSCGQKVQW